MNSKKLTIISLILGIFTAFSSHGMELTKQEKKLHRAAIEGRKKGVKKALAKEARIDIPDAVKFTALIHAAHHSRDHVVQYLLNRGANNSITDGDKQTTLHRAVQANVKKQPSVRKRKNLATIDLLLNNNIELLNAKTLTGDTPLNLAIAQGYIEGVYKLIQHKADLNAVNNWGLTCLMNAIMVNNSDMVVLLISSGADMKQVTHPLLSEQPQNCLAFAQELASQDGTYQDIYEMVQLAARDKNCFNKKHENILNKIHNQYSNYTNRLM